MHLKAKLLVPETDMADENSAEIDSIAVAYYVAATNN